MQQGDLVATVWQDKRSIAVLSNNIQPVMGSALRHTGRGESELYLFIMDIFFIADPHIFIGQLLVNNICLSAGQRQKAIPVHSDL